MNEWVIWIWSFGACLVYYRYALHSDYRLVPSLLTSIFWPIVLVIAVWLLIFDYKDISQD